MHCGAIRLPAVPSQFTRVSAAEPLLCASRSTCSCISLGMRLQERSPNNVLYTSFILATIHERAFYEGKPDVQACLLCLPVWGRWLDSPLIQSI